MITVPGLASEALGSYLSTHLGRRFHSTEAHLTELIPSIARLSLECIGNSDALYHNVEHTMLVTLVGYDIMKGRALLTHTTPGDYSHLLVACLLHDIGYVRGLLKGDGVDGYVIDGRGNKVTVPRGSSDAALLQYHVDRSKLFVLDRLSNHDHLDAERIARRYGSRAVAIVRSAFFAGSLVGMRIMRLSGRPARSATGPAAQSRHEPSERCWHVTCPPRHGPPTCVACTT